MDRRPIKTLCGEKPRGGLAGAARCASNCMLQSVSAALGARTQPPHPSRTRVNDSPIKYAYDSPPPHRNRSLFSRSLINLYVLVPLGGSVVADTAV
ncbi:hypothetical protein PYW08_007269 [Mythimna loreyi]|uniref:Uncharacterized protein n=1 Tax=Mythimna loreyi TaxID=667449 RepID=A0ACC2RAI0_9NEOP|nr:hypothetical protein PYW08_007269 [Mythimna loreyi]